MALDVLTLPLTSSGNRYAVLLINYLTKWPEVFATDNHRVETIARLLMEHIICRHGVPLEILSDRGADFISELVTEVCRLAAIKKLNTSAYHPQTDGMVERFNRTLTDMIAKYAVVHGNQWDHYLNYLLFAYRVKPHSSTGASPFQLLNGRDARLPTETDMSLSPIAKQLDQDDYASQLRTGLASAWEVARARIQSSQEAYKRQYDTQPHEFALGDQVFVYMPQDRQKGKYCKLARPYHGPYEVTRVRGNNLEMRAKNKPGIKPLLVHVGRRGFNDNERSARKN